MTDKKMVLTTSSVPPVGKYEILGIVFGVAVIARNIVSDLGATLKNATGGELKTYSALIQRALGEAMDRLSRAAERKGADGVFAIRIATPQVTAGAAEIILMGTAYKERP